MTNNKEREHKTDGTPCWCNPRVVKVLSKKDKELFEKLADIEHQRWADWQKHIMKESFKITGVFTHKNNNKMVQLEIPIEYWDNWERQINTPYSELSEKEKDSDREQVNRYWDLIKRI